MFVRAAVVFLAVAVSAAPASAQQVNDVRCLLVSNLFAKASKDPKAKQLSEVSKYYYLGKLQGRVSSAQLKTQAIAQAKALNAQNAGPAMNACAKQLQTAIQTTEATLKQVATGAK